MGISAVDRGIIAFVCFFDEERLVSWSPVFGIECRVQVLSRSFKGKLTLLQEFIILFTLLLSVGKKKGTPSSSGRFAQLTSSRCCPNDAQTCVSSSVNPWLSHETYVWVRERIYAAMRGDYISTLTEVRFLFRSRSVCCTESQTGCCKPGGSCCHNSANPCCGPDESCCGNNCTWFAYTQRRPMLNSLCTSPGCTSGQSCSQGQCVSGGS